jgi:hypothetical protein
MIRQASLVRLASGLALLQGLAHAFALAVYSPHHGAAEIAVVSAMQHNDFAFGGPWPHSYWDFYTGYAWLAALACFIQAAVLWIAAYWSPRVSIAPLLCVFLAANFIHAAFVLRFFFLRPLYADLLIALCLLLALADRKTARNPPQA